MVDLDRIATLELPENWAVADESLAEDDILGGTGLSAFYKHDFDDTHVYIDLGGGPDGTLSHRVSVVDFSNHRRQESLDWRKDPEEAKLVAIAFMRTYRGYKKVFRENDMDSSGSHVFAEIIRRRDEWGNR